MWAKVHTNSPSKRLDMLNSESDQKCNWSVNCGLRLFTVGFVKRWKGKRFLQSITTWLERLTTISEHNNVRIFKTCWTWPFQVPSLGLLHRDSGFLYSLDVSILSWLWLVCALYLIPGDESTRKVIFLSLLYLVTRETVVLSETAQHRLRVMQVLLTGI